MVSKKEIAKQIREELKAVKGYKFSVTMDSFSGGSSITVAVMLSSKRMIRNMSEIPEITDPATTGRYTRDEFVGMQTQGYHQLSQYQLRSMDDYKPESWNNGVFLTEQGHNDLKKIVEIVENYHRDDSNSSVDYFDCNFYFNLALGKWDNPFVDGVN